jgi:hypothetical protein
LPAQQSDIIIIMLLATVRANRKKFEKSEMNESIGNGAGRTIFLLGRHVAEKSVCGESMVYSSRWLEIKGSKLVQLRLVALPLRFWLGRTCQSGLLSG